MKRILLPTDFSIFADFAFETALNICKKTGAALHIFHVAPLPDGWEELGVDEKLQDTVNRELAIKTKARLSDRQQQAEEKGISCHIHFKGGSFLDGLIELLEELKVDLIVMGSHGKSGMQDTFIGSYTQKVLRKLDENLLVVKNKPLTEEYTSAVFVSGLDKSEQPVFEKFLDILKQLEVPMVHVLAINLSGFFSQPSVLMEEALKDFSAIAESKGFKCDTHFYPDYSVESGIRHFSEETQVNLIGISHNSDSAMKRIFLGSNVETLIQNSVLPVLSLDH